MKSDLSLGDDPPALFATLLQGPIVFTGLENDTSHIKFGINYPEIINTHSVNLPMNFFNMYFLDLYPLDDETVWGYYNRIRGLDRFGNPYNPCTFEHGIVNPESICSEVNPYLLFSGDPLTQQGWINTKYKDQMDIITAGPFDLKKDIPQYIIAAYTAGKGTDHLNSISITRDLVYSTILEYNSNFNNMTFENGEPWFPVTDYFLHQNYPNPFNPGTVISYQLPVNGKVTLKVYDILGNEVSILVNEEKPSGTYEVEFNGSKYASGVYFYQLSATGGAGSFMETKKMILIK